MKNEKALDYIAIITPDIESGYNVTFPDLPGCVTCGETYEEAIEMAKEVLDLWLEVMRDDNIEIPKPSILSPVFTYIRPRQDLVKS